MENQSQSIASELKISELKQSNLYKSYEQLHSQASSMLVFSVQWKDLETHFDSTRKSIQTSIDTLSVREKAFSLREKELATRESLMESGFESKKKQLETHFSEREKAFSLREKELATRESQIHSDCESKKKYLETHFSVSFREKELATRETQFESKKKEFKSLEGLIGERQKEIELAKRHADSLQTLIVENLEELELKEREFKAIEASIAETSSEFDRLKGSVEEEEKKLERAEDCVRVTRTKVFSLGKKVKQLTEEIASKQRGFKNNIASEERVLKVLRKNVVANEERIKASQSSLDRLEKEIQSKNDKLNSISTQLESKEEQAGACQRSIDELEKEIQSKEDKLKAVSGSIASCSSELESKETRLEFVRKEVESKEESFVSLKNSADQIARAWGKRESEIERLSKEFELKAKSCESKVEECNLICSKAEDCLKEVDSLQISLKKSFSDLETKEKQFKKRVIEFKSKQKIPDSPRNPTEVRSVTVNTTVTASTPSRVIKAEPLQCAQNKNALVFYPASNRNPRAMEGRDLWLLLNRHLKTHDSVCDEVFAVLKASTNPPKLALDAMEGLYPSKSSGESREFGVSVIRRSCILMLEQLEKLLMEASPAEIGCEVRDEAKRFAKNWRAKMKETEMNYLEALGFLQFLTSFRLTSEFDPNEIYELRQAISTADKALVIPEIDGAAENPLASIMMRPPIVEVNTMLNICTILQKSADPARFVLQYIQLIFSKPFSDTNVLRNCIILFDQLLKTSPQIHPSLREDAMRVAADWKANIESRGGSTLDILVFLQFLDTYGLVPSFDVDEILNLLMKISRDAEVLEVCCQVGIAKRIPDMIQYLIQKKNVVDAVRLICAFKLTDKFEPVKLLTLYMDDLKEYNTKNCKGVKRPIEEKEKITNDEITALKAIIDCVTENKPDCLKFPLGPISKRIGVLERIMIQRRRTFDDTVLVKAEREERNQSPYQPRNSKRGRGPGGGFDHHQEQGRHKLPRQSSPVNQQFHHCPPGFVYHPNYASNVCNNDEHALSVPPRQFHLPGSYGYGARGY